MGRHSGGSGTSRWGRAPSDRGPPGAPAKPVVAVPQANALALVQDGRRAGQIVGGQILGLDADHVLATEGGGDRLGKAPWGAEPIAAEQGQDHPAARQLLAQALLPALPGADVVFVVKQGPGWPIAPDALADRRGDLVVLAAMADKDNGHLRPAYSPPKVFE
jgi:hypothetical protein